MQAQTQRLNTISTMQTSSAVTRMAMFDAELARSLQKELIVILIRAFKNFHSLRSIEAVWVLLLTDVDHNIV